MKNIKHVGRIKNTGAKILVVFRTLPGESNMCLVVRSESLTDMYHDAIMELVETDFAQESYEFGEALFSKYFPDGRVMLAALQQDGKLQKFATDQVVMTPTPNSEIRLSDLNVLIAEQRNCAIDDLCTFVKGAPKTDSAANKSEKADIAPIVDPDVPTQIKNQAKNDQPLSDKDLARSYRSQADAMYKEAARLRKEADDLDPPAKKSAKTKVTESA
jgi:hypothetical protein